MYITELFDQNPDKKETLGFDLMDDLVFFMNNDPEFYRKRYYPTMLKFNKYCQEGKKINPRAFENLVKEAYGIYKTKFPVEGLEKDLSEEMCENICKSIHEQECNNVENKFYEN